MGDAVVDVHGGEVASAEGSSTGEAQSVAAFDDVEGAVVDAGAPVDGAHNAQIEEDVAAADPCYEVRLDCRQRDSACRRSCLEAGAEAGFHDEEGPQDSSSRDVGDSSTTA